MIGTRQSCEGKTRVSLGVLEETWQSSQGNTRVSLGVLEETWAAADSVEDLLSSLHVHIPRILVQNNQVLYLDMMKFVGSVLSTVCDTAGPTVSSLLSLFTERFLAAAHLASHKYFTNETFNQSRYLDCVSAILSVWIDSTDLQDNQIWRKLVTYIRGSQQHLLDTVLQSQKISVGVVERSLRQITCLPNMEMYLKYTVCSRRTSGSKYSLFALSHSPTAQEFSNWAISKNLATIGGISEFSKRDKYDDVILESLCNSYYTLPPRAAFCLPDRDSMQQGGTETVHTDSVHTDSVHTDSVHTDSVQDTTTSESAETLFFIDRGEVPDTAPDTLATQHEPEILVAEEPCIKIKNRRKSNVTHVTKEVLVIKPVGDVTARIAKESTLTPDKLAALPGSRSSRPRHNSVESDTSVESVASRTRNRCRETAPQPPLANIPEESEKSKSGIKKRTKTPGTKCKIKTPGTKNKAKSRKVSESVVEETPQIPRVSRTRSRKIVV